MNRVSNRNLPIALPSSRSHSSPTNVSSSPGIWNVAGVRIRGLVPKVSFPLFLTHIKRRGATHREQRVSGLPVCTMTSRGRGDVVGDVGRGV